MSKIRLGAVALVSLIALGLVVQAVIHQSYWIAAATLCAGLACVACVSGFSCLWDEYSGIFFQAMVGLAIIFGVAHVFFASGLFDMGRQKAQISLFSFFGDVQGGSGYGPISPAARAVAAEGLQRCGMQKYLDMRKAIVELQKVYYLGPGSSLALAAYETWLAERPKQPTCLSTFIDFSYLAPEPAKSFLLLHKEIAEHLPRQ